MKIQFAGDYLRSKSSFKKNVSAATKVMGKKTSDIYYNQMKSVCAAEFFLGNLRNAVSSSATPHIADIGACSGDLTRLVRANYPHVHTTNVDLTDYFTSAAKKEDIEAGLSANTTYLCANALKLPFENFSMDALLYSRVLHEIFSYEFPELNDRKFSKESIKKVLQEAYRVLKIGGVIIIQDPAKPENYDETVTISNFADQSANLSDQDLLETDVTVLKGEDLLKRFLIEFEPAKNNYTQSPEGYKMQKWLASEFIRHRKFNETKEHWAHEICEQYSPLTQKEYEDFAKTTGFELVSSEIVYKPDEKNLYAYSNSFDVRDSQGDKLLSSKDFPLGMLLAFKKK